MHVDEPQDLNIFFEFVLSNTWLKLQIYAKINHKDVGKPYLWAGLRRPESMALS